MPAVSSAAWHSLHPMHGRGAATPCAIVFATSCGSAMCARVMPTMSAAPEATTRPTSSRVRKRPVTMVGTVSARDGSSFHSSS